MTNKEILKEYTQEEIEELARKQLESIDYETNLTLKIEKIDKEYKKHNKKSVARALANGSMIMIFSLIILNSKSNIANFGTRDLSGMFEEIKQIAFSLTGDETLLYIYTLMFEGLQHIIDKIGLIGIILATKSLKFILSTVKDGKKSIDIKKDLNILEEQLAKYERSR